MAAGGGAMGDRKQLADNDGATTGAGAVAHGLAFIFHHLTTTNDLLRREHFREREMDITPEQCVRSRVM